jgi:hypothetical protein
VISGLTLKRPIKIVWWIFFFLQIFPNPMKNAYANFQINYVDDSLSKAYFFVADLFYYVNTNTRSKRDDREPPSPSAIPPPSHQ